MKIQFQFLIILFLIFGILKDANAVFKTRIPNFDNPSPNTNCPTLDSINIFKSISPYSNSDVIIDANSMASVYRCHTTVELATYADLVGTYQLAVKNNTDATIRLDRLDGENLKREKQIYTEIGQSSAVLSQQIEKVIQELVANPHLIGNNSQTTGNRQALEALITAIVKKELKEAVKLNCQNTIGE
jgi:hypothetical protein